jgi:predicted 3-demethylubiquinone-9 3-methyltransferase (glyoxalase superfamily)
MRPCGIENDRRGIEMSKITPCLWFEGYALDAAKFYTSVFPSSELGEVHRARSDTPGNKAGDVLLVTFTLAGQAYQALNGGPHDKFNDAISFSVSCADQAEVDRLWSKLTADGGKPVQCGWLKDKFGVSWQIVPKRLMELLGHPDPDTGKRVMQAMLKMVKLDIAALEAAAAGRDPRLARGDE